MAFSGWHGIFFRFIFICFCHVTQTLFFPIYFKGLFTWRCPYGEQCLLKMSARCIKLLGNWSSAVCKIIPFCFIFTAYLLYWALAFSPLMRVMAPGSSVAAFASHLKKSAQKLLWNCVTVNTLSNSSPENRGHLLVWELHQFLRSCSLSSLGTISGLMLRLATEWIVPWYGSIPLFVRSTECDPAR